jgi:histidinol phosphatase-like enzyme
LFLKAAEEFDLDMPGSVLIGDKESDIIAGRNAGINNCFYIRDIF